MSVVPEPVAPEPWATSFIELYRAERAGMVRLAFLLTGGDASAEELVHDAFLAVHRRWAHVDNPSAYLRTSVVNACTSHHRRRVRALRAPRHSATEWIDAP